MLNALEVEQFRNLAAVRLEFSAGVNLITGPNGAGKTTLLEAIHLLARGKSFRSSRATNLIQRGQSLLRARAVVACKDGSSRRLAIEKTASGARKLRLDGEEARSAAELAALLPIQLLLPSVAELVFGGPAVRREFVDWGLFHVKQEYVQSARRYRKLLRQRNTWLRQSHPSEHRDDPWLTLITETGHEIGESREHYLNDLYGFFTAVLRRLDSEIQCEWEYARGGYEISLAETRKKMTEALQREVKLGGTQIGPHRADLVIRLATASASETASRGQGKAIASAAALAQASFMADRLHKRSVVLIDDIGAEFDKKHRSNLLDALAGIGCQVIATATEVPAEGLGGFGDGSVRVFHVEQGTAKVLESY